jgi:hypothetical protein
MVQELISTMDDVRGTREIKVRAAMAKAAFNKEEDSFH